MDPRHLREATRADHEATEATFPLSGPELSRESYIRALQVLLPVVASWERWIAKVAPASWHDLLLRHRRTHLLQQDLQSLGATPLHPEIGVNWDAAVDTLQAGEPEAGRRSEAALTGALYVMEGSTLGGRFLARHVEQVLGLDPGAGNAYFHGHGEKTGQMWQEVLAIIRAVPDAREAEVVEAAQKTFRAFGDAMQRGMVA